MENPSPPCFWTVTAEPWAEAMMTLAPDLRGQLFSMIGRVFPDDCPLTVEQVRDHPEAIPFRVSCGSSPPTRVGVVVGKDTALDEFLDELCRGWPSEVEFFENGVWTRIQYGTPTDDWS
jgi:hypothetical protein